MHWEAGKRILQYIKGTVNIGCISESLPLHCSMSLLTLIGLAVQMVGYALFFGPNLISWSSRKQARISRSSTEAEYKALANGTAEAIWIQSFLRQLDIPQPRPPVLWCDNFGATYLTADPVFHARTKHIEVDFHFVREKIAQGALLSVLFHLQIR